MSTIGSEVKHLEKEKQKTERKEHILVCLSFSPSNEKIIRTAAQMARAFGANFTALYVQTAEPAEKTPEDQARLQKHIRLAGQSGAEIVTTHSEDIALQIAEYARISEVTRIVIGKSMMDQGFFRKRRGWTERLTDLVPDLEIHIIPDSNIITIYLVGVMMTSILTSGYTCSVISSVISVVLFNYFLTEPRLTLYAYGSGYPVTFAIMLGISILTGTLASKLKENAKLSARDAFLTKILFNTSQLLQKAEDASEIFDITATKLVKLLGRDLTAAPAGAQESRIVRGTLYSAQTIDVLKRNRVFREGTIGGYVAAGIDGVELFSSTKKSCPDCLSRKNGTGKTEYFHRSVVCMTVGKSPHVIFGQEMLKPRDGSEKDEGGLTGAKRLIRHLKKRHSPFADVIVADALYLNAPFINTLKECGLETVIRLKDERRLLFQDAESMFQRDEGRKRSFRKGKKSIEVWDLSGFEIDLTWTIS